MAKVPTSSVTSRAARVARRSPTRSRKRAAHWLASSKTRSFRVRRDELSVAPWWTWRELALRLLPLAALVLVAALLSVLFSSSDERNLEALELEALGTESGFSATSAGEPVLSIALEPFPPER
jgi:hypothetical protein